MSSNENSPSAQARPPITVVGKLPKLSSNNLARMAAFLVQGNDVIAQSPVTANGFRFRLAGSIAFNPCLLVILGPKGLNERTLLARTDLPSLPLAADSARKAHTKEASRSEVVTLDFTSQHVNDKLVDAWWHWCRTYTVSGTVQTPNGCPV